MRRAERLRPMLEMATEVRPNQLVQPAGAGPNQLVRRAAAVLVRPSRFRQTAVVARAEESTACRSPTLDRQRCSSPSAGYIPDHSVDTMTVSHLGDQDAAHAWCPIDAGRHRPEQALRSLRRFCDPAPAHQLVPRTSIVGDRVPRRSWPMRPYEVMVVIDPALEDAQVKATFGRVSEIIIAAGGTIRSAELMGKRKLAYEINKKSEGMYGLVAATFPQTVVAELNRVLQLADEVMRHKVILIPEKNFVAAASSDKLRAASSSPEAKRQDRHERQESETPA